MFSQKNISHQDTKLNLEKKIFNSSDLHLNIVKFLDTPTTISFHSTYQFLNQTFANHRMILIEKRKELLIKIAKCFYAINKYKNVKLLSMTEDQLQAFFNEFIKRVQDEKSKTLKEGRISACIWGSVLGGGLGLLGFGVCFACFEHCVAAIACGSVCGCGMCIVFGSILARPTHINSQFTKEQMTEQNIIPKIEKFKILNTKIQNKTPEPLLIDIPPSPYENAYPSSHLIEKTASDDKFLSLKK
jgi:hypothetical protein